MDDPDILDILESGQADPLESDDEEGEGVTEEAPTPLDLLKGLVEKNLSMLGTPGQVDDSPFTLPALREKYPQVIIYIFATEVGIILLHIVKHSPRD